MIYLVDEKMGGRIPDSFRKIPLPNGLTPSTELYNWFYDMYIKDKEVLGMFADRYRKELDENPVKRIIEGYYEQYGDLSDLIFIYRDDFKEANGEDVLKKYLKELGYEVGLFELNTQLFSLSSKDAKKIRDLFVKLVNVYKNDFYVFGLRYIYPGEKSDDRLNGKTVCTLTEDYVQLIEQVFGKHDVYVSDIREFKEDFTKFQIIENDKIKNECIEFCSYVNNQLIDFNTFRFSMDDTENEDIIERFLDKKLICTLSDPTGKCPDVTIGSSMIPCVSEKTITDIIYSMSYYDTLDNQTIYQLVMEMQFTHFTIHMQFFYI